MAQDPLSQQALSQLDRIERMLTVLLGNKEAQLRSTVSSGNLESFHALLDLGAEEFSIDLEGDGLLGYAAIHHQAEMISFLLSRGHDPVKATAGGYTPLLRLFFNGSQRSFARVLPALQTLIPVSPLDHQDNQGMTALMYTSFYGLSEARDALLKAGADANLVNENGHTAEELVAFGEQQRRYGGGPVVVLSGAGDEGDSPSETPDKSKLN